MVQRRFSKTFTKNCLLNFSASVGPQFSDLIDFVEEEEEEEEEDDLRLPTFGHPDTVLKATKELRDRDRNQASAFV